MKKKRRHLLMLKYWKQAVLMVILCCVVLGACLFEVYHFLYLQTEDAYVNAHVVQISSRITGQVAKLYIEDNQYVQKGQVLFQIDSYPFRIAIDKAQADVDRAKASLDMVKANSRRVLILAQEKVKSLQDKDNAVAIREEAKANLRQAQVNLAQENLNLSYATIIAPANGWISMLKLREGSIVEAHKPLFALIDQNEFWVDANFKETDLQYIYPGQLADIEVDMYPGYVIKGIVTSISRGSGTAFSLLPPQNATGNWVKVTQRVPVRVRIPHNNPHYPLRIGTTATVTIKRQWAKEEWRK